MYLHLLHVTIDAIIWLYCSACARSKKQAKKQAALQLLEQLSADTDLLERNDDSFAAADNRCSETTLASCRHMCTKFSSENIQFHSTLDSFAGLSD